MISADAQTDKQTNRRGKRKAILVPAVRALRALRLVKKANYGSLFIQCSVKHVRQSQNTSVQVTLYSTVLILKMNVAILEHSSDIENECGHTRACLVFVLCRLF